VFKKQIIKWLVHSDSRSVMQMKQLLKIKTPATSVYKNKYNFQEIKKRLT
jgi:hypothetical protein